MKFCQPHWDRLREEIDANGLSGFVARDGEQAAQQLADEAQGINDQDAAPDPLMRAHWMILDRAIKQGGPYILTGDYCPLCELEKHTEEKAASWIIACCASLRAYFIEKGWIKEPAIQ